MLVMSESLQIDYLISLSPAPKQMFVAGVVEKENTVLAKSLGNYNKN